MEPGEMAGILIMDLYIETLTGTAFELRVSPFETVNSVKNKIYRLEGIPVSQQHLIWNDKELDDSMSLHECEIPNGSTLRLVLGLRGGPINTRRVPLDLPYSDSTASSLSDLFPHTDGPTTFLVFRDGDQLNFFQVVDRGDGTLSPLAESLSSLREEEEWEGEEGEAAGEGEEMQRRLRLVQLKLDQMRLNRRTAALRHAKAAREGRESTRLLPPIETPPLPTRSVSYDPRPAPRPVPHSRLSATDLPSASRLRPELIQIGSSRLSHFVPSPLPSPLRHGLETSATRRDTLPPVETKPQGDKGKRKKRCFQCHKKTGLANSYQCRCGNNFCSKHRYAEAHCCPFDYKAEGRRVIQESNPVVAASKLPKI